MTGGGEATGVVLLYFWAPWCGPCRLLRPLILEAERLGQGQLHLIHLNVDQAADAVKQYGVLNVPTLILMRGESILARRAGALTRTQFADFLAQSDIHLPD